MAMVPQDVPVTAARSELMTNARVGYRLAGMLPSAADAMKSPVPQEVKAEPTDHASMMRICMN